MLPVLSLCVGCGKRGNRFFFVCALVQFSVLKVFLGPGACVCALVSARACAWGGGDYMSV